MVDAISAMYVKARYLVDALRSGNRYHIVRAAAVEASGGAARGKSEGKRERELFELARRLAEQAGDDEGYALYQITYGISEYVRGRWRSSLQILEEACAQARRRPPLDRRTRTSSPCTLSSTWATFARRARARRDSSPTPSVAATSTRP